MSTDIAPAGRESSAAARLQILATEHWSLLATRSLTYTEALSRVTIFLAILSGAVIAIALVAQADGFGPTAISIAIPVLCVVLFAGVEQFVEFVQCAESLGYDGYWAVDHPIQTPGCWTTHAGLAAVTHSILLGTFVKCVLYRGPPNWLVWPPTSIC